jgi:hypothetical protein
MARNEACEMNTTKRCAENRENEGGRMMAFDIAMRTRLK